jgi:hypothetical protein
MGLYYFEDCVFTSLYYTIKVFMLVLCFQSGNPSASSRASTRKPGEEPHIGKYRLLKTIGKGNFAKVKLAKHIPTGKEVLQKICLIYLFVKKGEIRLSMSSFHNFGDESSQSNMQRNKIYS